MAQFQKCALIHCDGNSGRRKKNNYMIIIIGSTTLCISMGEDFEYKCWMYNSCLELQTLTIQTTEIYPRELNSLGTM